MPNYRAPRDYFFGTLLNSAAISDTSLVSASFTALGTAYGTNFVLPLTLHDPVLGVHEVVWVTAHSAASNTVTVERAKEGTAARAWPASTQVISAPTLRDGMTSIGRSSLPSDRHTGQRVALADEGLVVQSTYDQGWQADVGAAVPGEFGLRLGGGAVPTTKVIIARGGHVSGTTDSNGRIAATYLTPFPTETLVAIPVLVSTNSNASLARDSIVAPTANGFTAYAYNPATGASVGAGVNITFGYIAYGY